MYNFIGKYTQTRRREQRKAIYALTKSIQAKEESNAIAARIRMAENLVTSGYSAGIIYRATGLSIDEYNNKVKNIPKRHKMEDQR